MKTNNIVKAVQKYEQKFNSLLNEAIANSKLPDNQTSILANIFQQYGEIIDNTIQLHLKNLSNELKESIQSNNKTIDLSIFNEGIADVAKTIGLKALNKVSFGQSKNVIQAKLADGKTADKMIAKWNNVAQNKPGLSTVPKLNNFVASIIHGADDQVFKEVWKKYKPFLVTSVPGAVDYSKVVPGKPLPKAIPKKVPGFLSKDQLKSFFTDIIVVTRQNQTLGTNTAKNNKSKPPINNTQPQVTQPTAPQVASNDTNNFIAQLPPNERAAAILQALPFLSSSDMQKIAGSLLQPKNP